MLKDWHVWQNFMMNSQPVVLAIMLMMLCFALLVLWNDLRNMLRAFDQVYAQTQKALRELGQQRFAIANLRQAIINPDLVVNEQDLFNDALNQLDELLKNLSTSDTAADNGKSIDQLKEREILTFVKKALRDNQIALAAQPVKTLTQNQTRFIEVYARVKIGTQYVAASKFLSVAKNNNLLSLIDQAFLLRTLQLVKKNADDDVFIAYFCNLSVNSFSNENLIGTIIKYLEAEPRLATRLIFELSQEDTFKLDARAKATFMRLIELGCRFSMDNVKMMGLDVDRLRDLQFSFVKFNIEAVIKEMDDSSGRRRWQRTRNLMASQGIEIIVEKVETVKQFDKLKDSSFNYAQGYYFGQPEIVT